MARLIRDGDFVGPGEQLTAAVLEEQLPDDWLVIANKVLVGGDGSSRELDFVVVGNHAIFVIDEKHWHGKILGDDKGWVLSGGDSQRSPITKMEMACRTLAGTLRRNVSRLAGTIRDRPFVHARVILSAPDVSWQIHDPRVATQVFRLDQVADELVYDDRRVDPHASIMPFRQGVIDELTRLRNRPRIPTRVNDYEVLGVLADRGASFTLLARHADGSDLILQLLERRTTELAARAAADRSEKLREYDALRRLGDLDRAARVHPYFSWQESGYWVVPMDPVPGASLRSLRISEPKPTPQAVVATACDAFHALADVHSAAILHRAISPDTVLVADQRVRFIDFSLARLPDTASLGGNPQLPASDAFVAPEVRLGFGFAEQRSDVYSLAASLLYWITGTEAPPEEPLTTDPGLRSALEIAFGAEAGDVVGRCFAKDERSRPSADEVAAALEDYAAELADKAAPTEPARTWKPPAVGDVIDGRYDVTALLGDGVSGMTFAAFDNVSNSRVVLKALLNPEYVRALAANEFNMLAGLTHPSLQKVFDVRPPDDPFHLKLEYIEGASLDRLLVEGVPDHALGLRVVREIGDLLRYLEDRNLVHRDISASNVLVPVDPKRPLILLDFGLAAAAQSLTAVGTARYRDPAVEHGEPWSPAADRYALAVLAYELVVGRLPYLATGTSPDKRTVLPLSADERAPIPAWLIEALERGVEPEPRDRFATAADMLAAFVEPPAQVLAGADREGKEQDGRRAIARRFVVQPDTVIRGGVADVYQATDLEDQSAPVALKVIREVQAGDRLADLFFQREVSSLRDLRHPNVVRLIDGGLDPATSKYWLALEWVPQTLSDFLRDRGEIAWDWYLRVIGAPLASALSAAHERQIVHRDVKPSNILVAADGTLKLADFGISVLKTHVPDDSRTLANFGSAPYAPPEREYLSDAVRDTFAFGVVTVEALAGHRLAEYGDVLPALESLSLPDGAYEVLRRCVSLDPAERPMNGLVLETLLANVGRPQQVLQSQGADGQVHCAIVGRNLDDQATAAAYRAGFVTANEFVSKDLSEGAYIRRAPTDDPLGDPQLFMYGQYWSYRARVQASPPRLLLISGRPEPAERLDQERDRCAMVPGPFSVGSVVTSFEAADAAIRGMLDRVEMAEAEREDSALDREERRLFSQWLAQLKASAELDGSREGAMSYRGARRDGSIVTLMLEEDPDETIVGQERVLRATDGFGRRFRGIVQESRGRTIEFWLEPGMEGDPPRNGVLAVDTGPSAIANKRQKDALNAVRFNGSSLRRPDLPELLLHPEKCAAAVEVPVSKWLQENLDDDKRLAVARAVGAPDFIVIQGPPGTGKTTLIAEVIGQELRRNPDARILLTSQGHVALDNALVALRRVLPDAFRLTRLAQSPGMVDEDVHDLLLERQAPAWRREIRRRSEKFLRSFAQERGLDTEKVKAALLLGNLRGLRIADDAAAEALAVAHQALHDASGEAGDDGAAIADRDALQVEVNECEHRMSAIERQIGEIAAELGPLIGAAKSEAARMPSSRIEEVYAQLLPSDSPAADLLQRLVQLQGEWLERVGRGAEFDEALLRSSHVVAATCVGLAGFSAAQNLTFDLCILDEASKAMATETLVPFVRASRWMLVGDQQQLPPFQEHALLDPVMQADFGLDPTELGRTLFDILWDGLPEPNKVLLRQQHRMVRPIGDLISHVFYGGALVSRRTSGLRDIEFALPKPVTWFDTSGVPARRERPAGAGHKSFSNQFEASKVVWFLRMLDFVRQAKRTLDDASILVLTPYRAQKQLIEDLLAREAGLGHGLRLEINTVDAAQGREADIVVLSVTRSNDEARPGFLRDRRRINVALSRAKLGLAIVGDASFCEAQDGPLGNAVAYIRDNPSDCALVAVNDE